MGLNKQKGNMYGFVTHTWNTIKGKCSHDCSYCYMKRFGEQKPVRFDKNELKTYLGNHKFIFVGSSCDMFAEDIPKQWIKETIKHCYKYDNTYLFQSKNPKRFGEFIFPLKTIFCTTLETNRHYIEIMGNAPTPVNRIYVTGYKRMITIEPIMDFDMYSFLTMLKSTLPYQINIGADSGNNNLPEPSKRKILKLIKELEKFTKVHLKDNLNRLLK